MDRIHYLEKIQIIDIVDKYNAKYKVADKSIPSAPNTATMRATVGGWVKAQSTERFGFIIKLGSGFPKEGIDKMFEELDKELPNVRWSWGNYGTNWTPVTPYEKT